MYVFTFSDFLDPVTQAPFDINSDYLHMPTNEERIKVGSLLYNRIVLISILHKEIIIS